MRPLSSRLMPAFSQPKPSVKGVRPTATSTVSASSDSAAPPVLGSICRVTPDFAFVALVTLLESLKAKPCFCSRRWKFFATSKSMPGRMRSRYSMTVIFAPSLRIDGAKFEADDASANDGEMSRHFRKFQSTGRRDDLLLVDLDAFELCHIGARGDDDVFRLNDLARNVDLATAENLSGPRMTVTLFFFNRKSTPLVLPSMASCLKPIIFGRSSLAKQ